MNETQTTHTHTKKHTCFHSNTHNNTTINICKSYPVIREVFVHNLPHFSLLVLQNVWCKKQNDVQHGCLSRQSCASMLRQRVSWDLRSTRKVNNINYFYNSILDKVNCVSFMISTKKIGMKLRNSPFVCWQKAPWKKRMFFCFFQINVVVKTVYLC